MRFRNLIAAAAIALTVVGCSQSSTSNPTGSQSSAVASKTSPNTDPAASTKPVNANIKANEPAKSQTPKSNGSTPMVTKPAVPKPTTGVQPIWQDSTVSAKDVAASTDQMLKGMSNVKADIQYRVTNYLGQSSGKLEQKIKGPTTYALMFPVIYNDKRHGLTPTIAYTRANGQLVSQRVADDTTSHPITTKKAAPNNLVQNWPTEANREIFAGLLDGRKPFSEYVAALLDPKNGYVTKVSERSMPSKGRLVRQYRISANRSGGAAAASMGQSAIALVIDADIHLPVSIVAVIKKPGAKQEDSVVWTAKWTNNVKFDAKEFAPFKPGSVVVKT